MSKIISTWQSLLNDFRKPHSITNALKDYGVITFGLLLYAIGWSAFLLPYEIAAGGLTGVSAIVYYVTGVELQITYFGVNMLLLLIAIKILGLKFCIKTIYGVSVLSVFLWLLQDLFRDANGNLSKILGPEEDFMACVIGSALCGFGLGQIFIHQGSTGGTDIIAAIVNKYKNVTMGRMILYCDIVIISSCYFIFEDWKRVLFGFATMFIVATVIDYVMNYVQQSVQFFIVTKKSDEVSKAILNDANCGATLIPSKGCYSGEPISIIMVIAHKQQSLTIFRIVHEIDPGAFISQTKAAGVYGEGFDKIKV
ncbi:MAG: YitT family protein [Prevotella sp.]|jgi:uncharacterized membrane-anchored protein YitT (DUF2179 family)|nr:YitT family protein [Prevotella sp.]